MTSHDTTSAPDFRVMDLDADEQVSDAFDQALGAMGDMLFVLGEHHSGDDARSFYVLLDGTVTWGMPGEPHYLALHLERDHANGTFRFEVAPLPLSSMAQSWLIHRGCPPDALTVEPGTLPADAATVALERRLVGDGDHFALGWSYSSDDQHDPVTLAVLRALDEHAASPFRVLVEEADLQSWTHTLCEGGFDTLDEAMAWAGDRLAGEPRPLPPVRPKPSSHPVAVVRQQAAPRSPRRSH
ncbi:hypothetical protein ACFV1X_21665 [Streptomyces coelicoflavus]|uniref:hypothetical protein n=1 Tax=Streptomyces coelicoflavus TaxID=285562 RepID=UPI003697893F